MTNRPERLADAEDTGFDENRDYVGEALGKLVPQWLARRAIDVSVTTDKRTYSVDEPIRISITFRNRLPVPLPIQTETARLWGWTVDGLVAASDEQPHLSETPNRFRFRPFEEKGFVREWSGRFKRTESRTRWELPAPGSYEIRGFLGAKGSEVEDTVTIRIE